jgi:ferrous iron transport protein A
MTRKDSEGKMRFMQGFGRRFKHGFMHRFGHRFRHKLMPEEKQTTLARMQAGQSGTVVQIHGSHHMFGRLSALGIRPGKRITKVSSMFMHGPITIQLGTAHVAIGFRMANKIIVGLD